MNTIFFWDCFSRGRRQGILSEFTQDLHNSSQSWFSQRSGLSSLSQQMVYLWDTCFERRNCSKGEVIQRKHQMSLWSPKLLSFHLSHSCGFLQIVNSKIHKIIISVTRISLSFLLSFPFSLSLSLHASALCECACSDWRLILGILIATNGDRVFHLISGLADSTSLST